MTMPPKVIDCDRNASMLILYHFPDPIYCPLGPSRLASVIFHNPPNFGECKNWTSKVGGLELLFVESEMWSSRNVTQQD